VEASAFEEGGGPTELDEHMQVWTEPKHPRSGPGRILPQLPSLGQPNKPTRPN